MLCTLHKEYLISPLKRTKTPKKTKVCQNTCEFKKLKDPSYLDSGNLVTKKIIPIEKQKTLAREFKRIICT